MWQARRVASRAGIPFNRLLGANEDRDNEGFEGFSVNRAFMKGFHRRIPSLLVQS